ncbi:hypothetical protein [Segatella bryantii]|uniref:hypothetical protein n=1 Tax=Segatella bryantii TaxID=77095 RepID=UPI00241C5F3B|nr:hypothetical protein [Segatella bryantii]
MDNSDSEDIVLTIDLHYVLDKEGLHDMDAEVHNKCGACVIDVLNHLSDVLDEDCQLDFSATQEGGVRDIYKLIIKGLNNEGSIAHDIFIGLVSAFISHFIGVAPSLDDSQKQLNRVEVLEKLKQGDYSDDEVSYVLNGDPKYVSNRNEFYRNLDKEPHVTKVECSAAGRGIPADRPTSEISKQFFKEQIVKEDKQRTTETFYNTSVMVQIPILTKDSNAKWRGLFNNQEIQFTINDKDFRNEIFSQKVHFVAGTSIKCDLTIETTVQYNKEGKITKNTKVARVDNVTSCYDGEVLSFKKKRFKKKKKNDKQQLSLFNDDDFK